jgi:hypothetical protein
MMKSTNIKAPNYVVLPTVLFLSLRGLEFLLGTLL